jgi:hypothetical protein
VGRRCLCRPSRLDNHDVAGVRLIAEPAVPQVGYFFPWVHENRRPIMHLTMRWSVECVVPIPTPKLNSHSGAKSMSIAGKNCCC